VHAAGGVVLPAAGLPPVFAALATAGVSVPTHPMRREALVTHSIKPIMDQAVTFYRPFEGWFNQTLRGEIVAGVTDPDEPAGFNHDSSLEFATRTASLLARKARDTAARALGGPPPR
jgi:hypothetical protein